MDWSGRTGWLKFGPEVAEKSRGTLMTDQGEMDRARQIIGELAGILRQLSDAEAGELLGTGVLDDLLKSILDPAEVLRYPTIADFLLANKSRATLLALVRHAITHNYSFKGAEE